MLNISESHPLREKHNFYFPDVEFPELNYLPPSEERWWEHLGKQLLLKFGCLAYHFNEKPKKPAGSALPKSDWKRFQ